MSVENGTGCVLSLQLTRLIPIATLVALLVIDFLIIFGNTLVIAAVLVVPKLHTTTNFLITSLAVSDLLLGLFVLPLSILDTLMPFWHFGRLLCRIWLTLDVWLSTASIFNLVMISLDRFLAVRKPLKYTLVYSAKVGPIFLFISWFCSSFASLPLIVIWTSKNKPTDGAKPPPSFCPHCLLAEQSNGAYIIFSSFISFIVPLSLIAILNVAIYQKVRNANGLYNSLFSPKTFENLSSSGQFHASTPINRRVATSVDPKRWYLTVPADNPTTSSVENKEKDSDGNNSDGQNDQNHSLISYMKGDKEETSPKATLMRRRTSTCPPDMRSNRTTSFLAAAPTGSNRPSFSPGCRTLSLMAKRRKAVRSETRVARTIFIVIGCFLACWLPFFGAYLLQAYSLCAVETGCMSLSVYTVAIWLGYFNSVINPFIYGLYSRDFRKAFRCVFRKLTPFSRRRGSGSFGK